MYYGYYISFGYRGWVGDRWILFPTIQEYHEYMDCKEDE